MGVVLPLMSFMDSLRLLKGLPILRNCNQFETMGHIQWTVEITKELVNVETKEPAELPY
jgi:hypothetical protein